MIDNSSKVIEVDIDEILPNRFQPRIQFDEDEILELSDSIKEHGVIQPIVVRTIGDKYEIIAGERRYKASVLAGKETVPVIVKNLNDKDSAEIALIENIQRKNLTPIEEALSYKKILDMGYITQENLATKLGKSQSSVANKIRLLNLSDEVQEALLENKISERHARSLLKLSTSKLQNEMLERIVSERLTVRRTDEEIEKIKKNLSENKSENIEKIEEKGEINMNNNMFGMPEVPQNQQPTTATFDIFGAGNQQAIQSQSVTPTTPEMPTAPNFDIFAGPVSAPTTPIMDSIPSMPVEAPAVPVMPSVVPVAPEMPTTSIMDSIPSMPAEAPAVPVMPSVAPVAPEMPTTPIMDSIPSMPVEAPVVPVMPSVAPVAPEIPTTPIMDSIPSMPAEAPVVPVMPSDAPVAPEMPTTPIMDSIPSMPAEAPAVESVMPSAAPETETSIMGGIQFDENGNVVSVSSTENVVNNPSVNLSVPQTAPIMESSIVDNTTQMIQQAENLFSFGDTNLNNAEQDFQPTTPSISEFKAPEPIIVTDYSKQYDPVMPLSSDNVVPTVDFKEVINAIRECSNKIEQYGFKIDVEEYDLANLYQVIFKIDK